MDARNALLALALGFAVPLSAAAGVLYKSVDSNGRITFSDVPVDGAVTTKRIETSESVKPAVGEDGARTYLALADIGDEIVARANARVDMAEHALALARRSIYGEHDPLGLVSSHPSRADAQRLEFYKRDVLEARKGLLRAVQQRNLYTSRPLA